MKTIALSQHLMRVAPFIKVAFVTGEKLVMLGECYEEIDQEIHYQLPIFEFKLDFFDVSVMPSKSIGSLGPATFSQFTVLGRMLNRLPKSKPLSRLNIVDNFVYTIYKTYFKLRYSEKYNPTEWFPAWIVERYRQYRITFKSGTYFTYYSERCLREGKYLRFQVLVEGQPNFWFTTLKIPLKLVSTVEETGS